MTKAEHARMIAWRLKILQWAGDSPRAVSRTCRHFGISRPAFYRWKNRCDAEGAAGLCDRPRRPHRSPRATAAEVVSKILYLRQQYHFGPGKIADYLKRCHEVSVARLSVHRILGKHGMARLPANQKHRPHKQRWQRYEKPQPFRIRVLQTDNGAEFQTHFHSRVESKDVRRHRVDAQEFYQLLDQDGLTDDIHLFNERLREWEDYYNYHRPHGALGGQTPFERLLAKARAGASRGRETLHDALPGTRVTFHSGDMGDTLPPRRGHALEGVSRRGRTSSVRGPVAGRREDGRTVRRVRDLA